MSATDPGRAVPSLAFDHLVIGVRDLPASVQWYERELGFAVTPGGRHPGKGTHNAVIVLESGYLELIAIVDEQEARAAHRGKLVDHLAEHGDGFVAYSLEVTDIEGLARRFGEAGWEATGPFAMQRVQPNGQVVSWRLLVPGGNQYREPWPFFIQWDTARSERFGTGPGRPAHRNGAVGVGELTVAVRDLQRAMDVSSAVFGLDLVRRGHRGDLAAESATYRLEGTRLTFLSPAGPGPLHEALETEGEGPFELTIAVTDMTRTATAVHPRLFTASTSGGDSAVRLDPAALGNPALRLVFRG